MWKCFARCMASRRLSVLNRVQRIVFVSMLSTETSCEDLLLPPSQPTRCSKAHLRHAFAAKTPHLRRPTPQSCNGMLLLKIKSVGRQPYEQSGCCHNGRTP